MNSWSKWIHFFIIDYTQVLNYTQIGTQASQSIGMYKIVSGAIKLTLIPKIVKEKDLIMYNHIYTNNDSEPSDVKDEGNVILSLVDIIDEDGLMAPLVLEFKDNSKAYKVVCND